MTEADATQTHLEIVERISDQVAACEKLKPIQRLRSFYSFGKIIFLPAGLKYQDRTISINRAEAGAIAVNASPIAICEHKAPDMTKKKPA